MKTLIGVDIHFGRLYEARIDVHNRNRISNYSIRLISRPLPSFSYNNLYEK